ncbi:MAG: ribokinase [Lachnospiraceae bacterium]|nr:ribokinase [Lachnospiraceae bacterium]
MKVLCFGSLNIDYTYTVEHFVQKGETLSSESLQVFSGGKGLNQTVALARAGAEVYHAGAVGTDGGFLLQLMKEAGANVENVAVLDEVRSGNAIIQKDKDGDNCIILYGGANQAITREQVDRTLRQFERGDFILLQNEINELAYVMERAHEKGMKIVLNPSPMDEKIPKLPLQHVDYFLLNEVEATQILRSDLTEDINGELLAGRLLEKFPSAAIVLTLGEKGSIYIDKKEKASQPIYKVRTVDTTAAGDTFTGFFIAGLLKRGSVKEAMELAAKASAIAVSRPGAAPSIPTLAETSHFW